jgi:hypothetical protein
VLGFTGSLRPFAGQPERRLGRTASTRPGADSGSIFAGDCAVAADSLVEENASDEFDARRGHDLHFQ